MKRILIIINQEEYAYRHNLTYVIFGSKFQRTEYL